MNFKEKRKHLRFDLGRPVPVFKTENDAFFGHMENLSIQGMMLSSETSREVGQEHEVSFSVQTEIEEGATIKCRVCSMWSGENIWHEPDPSKRYCTGFQITGISDSAFKTLGDFIKTLAESRE